MIGVAITCSSLVSIAGLKFDLVSCNIYLGYNTSNRLVRLINVAIACSSHRNFKNKCNFVYCASNCCCNCLRFLVTISSSNVIPPLSMGLMNYMTGLSCVCVSILQEHVYVFILANVTLVFRLITFHTRYSLMALKIKFVVLKK